MRRDGKRSDVTVDMRIQCCHRRYRWVILTDFQLEIYLLLLPIPGFDLSDLISSTKKHLEALSKRQESNSSNSIQNVCTIHSRCCSTVINPYRKKDIFVFARIWNNFTRKLLIRTNKTLYFDIPYSNIKYACLRLATLNPDDWSFTFPWYTNCSVQ